MALKGFGAFLLVFEASSALFPALVSSQQQSQVLDI